MIETDTVCGAKVLLELLGKRSFNAFGLTSVEVSMKKINNKKTMSVIDDMLKLALILFLERIPIITYLEGSFRISKNSVVLASILNTTFSTFETKRLYAIKATIPTIKPATVVTMAV